MNLPEQDYNTIKYTIGHSLPETYRILTKRNSEREENEFVKLFVKKADEIMNLNTLVYPEVFELMPMIKEKGYKTGIISTKYRYRIQGVLERENLNNYFDLIVGGEDVSNHKPDPEGHSRQF
jgi:phosphoglycolate phosphatase